MNVTQSKSQSAKGITKVNETGLFLSTHFGDGGILCHMNK